MFNFLFKQLENVKFSYLTGVVSFLAIVAIRYQLEMILESRRAIAMHPSLTVSLVDFFHVVLSWASVLIVLVIGLARIGGIKWSVANRIALLALPLICLPPILDYLLGTSGAINYQFDFKELSSSYFQLFNPYYSVSYVTTGVRVEILGLVVLSFIYIYSKAPNFNWLRALATALWGYTCIFAFGFLPAIWNNLLALVVQEPSAENQLAITDVQVSVIWYLPLVLLIFPYWLSRSFPILWKVVLNCLRPTRSLIYLLIGAWGFIASSQSSLVVFKLMTIYDYAILILSSLSVLSLFVSLTAINDLSDQKIDQISNPQRPLASGLVSRDSYKFVAILFGILSFVFGLSASLLLLYPLATIFSLGYLYSCEPFRLRRFVGVAHLVITAIAALVFILGGILVHHNLIIEYLPANQLLPICLMFFIGSHLKDIKDTQSDARFGVTTLSTIFGEHIAYYAIGVLFVVSMATLVFLNYFSFNFSATIALIIFIVCWLYFRDAERLFSVIVICLSIFLVGQG